MHVLGTMKKRQDTPSTSYIRSGSIRGCWSRGRNNDLGVRLRLDLPTTTSSIQNDNIEKKQRNSQIEQQGSYSTISMCFPSVAVAA
jgi:hypothetical protein